MQTIPLTVNSGQLVEVANLDSHAKTIYENIVSLEKSTKGFDQQEFLKNIKSKDSSMTRLTQINQEYGEISGNIKKAKMELEKLGSTLTELKHVEGYVTELEHIQENVYNRDGPVGKSLRSWALEIISQKASEYLEKLNTNIQRISLLEKTRDVNISCYSRNTMLDIQSLSGGEQVSIALALRLGMSHLLGASNLNFMILDEPTAHLDSERRKSLVNVLSQLTSLKEDDSSMQFIIITHDAEIFDDSSVESIYKFESNPNGTVISRLKPPVSLANFSFLLNFSINSRLDNATTAESLTGSSGSFSAFSRVSRDFLEPITPNAIAASCRTNMLGSFFVASSNGTIPLL